jgi:hypothetical protein
MSQNKKKNKNNKKYLKETANMIYIQKKKFQKISSLNLKRKKA